VTPPRRLRPRLDVVLRDVLLVATGLAVLAFLAAAGVRRLNFDESLALRSGWLEIAGQPTAPPFHMPVVLGLGAMAHAMGDPGRLFLVGRLVAAGAVLAALAWMLWRTRFGAIPALAAALICLLQAGFAVHAYEMRYGWSILVAWMLAYGLIRGRSAGAAAGLGGCIAWLAAHHLKGVFFAGFLELFAVAAILVDGRERLKRLATLHLAALGIAGTWIVLSVASGHLDDLVAVYGTFAGLAAGAQKVWPWTALGTSFARDAAWWLLAAVALAGSVNHVMRTVRAGGASRVALRDDPELWAVLFAAVPLLFLFVHPHPWPYMLAPCAPFLALVMVSASRRVLSGRRRLTVLVAAGAIALLAGYGAVTGIWPGSSYAASLASPRSHQVATLRLLQRVARPDEPIIDPSGMAYFQPPCTPEWYLDSLFAPRAADGTWMHALQDRSATECPWVLSTYRLSALPETVRERLARDYGSVSGGLGIARERPDLLRRPGWARLPYTELFSFWW